MKTTNENALKARLMFSLLGLLYMMIMVFAHSQVNAQVNKPYKNTMYVESIGATGFGASINYKRSAWIGNKTSLNASAGIGCILYSFNGKPDLVVPITCTLVHGFKNSFEWGGGISIITQEKIYAPNFTLGYRHQRESFYIWVGVVGLFFYESNSNYEDYQYYHYSRRSYMGFAPVPGIRIGRSF